jgi:hypothetical protein
MSGLMSVLMSVLPSGLTPESLLASDASDDSPSSAPS